MKSSVYAAVLTAVVVFSCFEATTCSTVSTTDNAKDNTTAINTATTMSPVGGNTTENGTGTTHTMASTTEISSSSSLTSVTMQPHSDSGTTLSSSISTITQYTDSSVSGVSDTTMTSISTTPACPHPAGFDAASFVGGIILALGVMVILVIVVKCYQHRMNKSELQYSQF